MPGPRFFSPSTFTWPIIAAMPKSIFATKAFAFLSNLIFLATF
jgi:hypothetical protein